MKAIKSLSRALWHFLLYLLQGRPVIAPAPVRKLRLEKCLGCEFHAKGWCNLCDCLLSVKTKIASEQCPDIPSRWARVPLARVDRNEECN